MMKCPKCSTDVQTGSRFCSYCGHSLQAACPHCGFVNALEAKFCGGCGLAVGAALPGARSPTDTISERRQLTVMFCDLVDSTVLSTRLDPEDHREVLRTYQSACAQAIAHYDGYVAQFLGDGIMAYFGYPRAHEDDAERSVLAGLAIIKAVAEIDIHGLQIRTRVGIATGLVVVGDKIAKGTDWEIAVVGETPNLAARIQGVARPGMVVIGPTTHSLLGKQFAYEALGPQQFKGFADPVPVWRVLGELVIGSRFKAVRSFDAVMVDRREEQVLLKNLGARTANGVCHTVLILGEAGIGKSRLARTLAEWMVEFGGARLVEMQCSAHHKHSALFPVINVLWQLVSGDADRPRTPALAWGALGHLLDSTLESGAADALPLFANLLSIPLPKDIRAPVLTPEQQRVLILSRLLDLLAGRAGGGPVLLQIEDLHWADPSTLEFVAHIVEHGGDRPLLALLTSRPEFDPPWVGSPLVTRVPLGRLPSNDAAELVRQTLVGQGLTEEVVESVVAKTDGVPLYLQEYAKALAESGEQEARHMIPQSLHDLLLARLDRLGEAKAVAQLAALIGREFDGRLLEAVWSSSPQSLWSGLETLVGEEVVYPKGEPSRPHYVFRHALIQDAAYMSLLKKSRAMLHLRIGEAVERDFPDIAATEPEWLAQHFASANLPLRAIPYWEQAGHRALQLAAFAEAGRHFEAALGQLAKLPEEPTRHGMELSLQLQLGMAAQAAQGYAAAGVKRAYQRARELCGLLGDTAELFPVLRGLSAYYIACCDFTMARELSEQCMRLGQQTGRPDYQTDAHFPHGYVLTYIGELREAAELLEKSVCIYKENDGEHMEFPSPQNPLIGSLSMLSVLTWIFGEARRSQCIVGELEQLIEQTERPFDKSYGLGFLGFLGVVRGRYEDAGRHGAAIVEIAKTYGYTLWLEAGYSNVFVSEGHNGDLPRSITGLRDSIDKRLASGTVAIVQIYILQLAELYRLAGEPWQALATLEEASALGLGHGELWFAAEYHRIRGELLLSQAEWGKGEAELNAAIKVARGQAAKLFELRAALGLYRLAPAGAKRFRPLLEVACGQIDPEDGAMIPEWQKAVGCLVLG